MSDVKSDISSRRFGGLFENLGVSAAIRVSPKPRPVFGIASSPEIGDKSSFLFDFTPFFDLLRSLLTEDATFHHGGAAITPLATLYHTSDHIPPLFAAPSTYDEGERRNLCAAAHPSRAETLSPPRSPRSSNGGDGTGISSDAQGGLGSAGRCIPRSRLSRPDQWDGCWNCRYRKMDYCSEIEQKVRDTEKACDSWLERGSIDD